MIISLLKDFGFLSSFVILFKCFQVYKLNKIKLSEINSIIKAIVIYVLIYQAGTIRWILKDLPAEIGSIDTHIWTVIDIFCFATFFIILIFIIHKWKYYK